jgi:hypothetical protein
VRRTAALCIIVLATAVALVWAVRVPLFQEPDESAHYDYAFAILNTHGAIRARDGRAATDTAPQLRFLENELAYRRFRYDPAFRPPPQYGTRSFFRAIDERANRMAFQPAHGVVPYVMETYPFGFYSLVAGAMALAAMVAPNSLIAAAFAARLCCVLLLPLFLGASYWLFRREGLGPAAPWLLAALAAMPACGWMFGYVQPDDLAAAELVVAVCVTLRWRARPSGPLLWALAWSLALLSITKQHYFLAAFGAAAACVAARSLRAAAVLALPVLALQAIALERTWRPAQVIALREHTLGAYAAAGPLDALAHALRLAYGFVDATLLAGRTFTSFWDTYSWMSEGTFFVPLIGRSVTGFALGVLALATIALVATTAFVQARVLARIVRVARRRARSTALRLLCDDVVFNTLLLFVFGMWALYVYSEGGTGQGRYWLAVSPLFLAASFKRLRRIGALRRPGALPALAGALAVLGGSFHAAALASIERRYYSGPPLASGVRVAAGVDRVALRGRTLAVSGWALDVRAGAPARDVLVTLDGRTVRARAGIARPDVARYFHDDALLPSGFRAALDCTACAPGAHTIEISVAPPGERPMLASRRSWDAAN